MLCNAWGISLATAEAWYELRRKLKPSLFSKQSFKKQWKRNLVQEGIEPNPGPASDSQWFIDIWNLNTQGANGCWNLLKECHKPTMLRVLCCQETRMRPNETITFEHVARRAGYHCFSVAGLATGGIPRGGVMILVDKRLICQLLFTEVKTNSQLLGVWIENVLVWAFYSPPPTANIGADPQIELCDLFIQGFEAVSFGRQVVWVAVGDANEVPGDSLLADCLASYGGQVLAQGVNTRWNSSREVDWFVTNVPDILEQPHCSDLFLSDHKAICSVLTVPPRELTIGRLQKRPEWNKLQSISTPQWRSLLETAWEGVAQDLPTNLVGLPVQEA